MAGRLRLRPLAPRDEAELLRIHATPEVARWWDMPGDGFPFSDDPDSTRLVIEVDGAVAGMIQYAEELEPKYRHASTRASARRRAGVRDSPSASSVVANRSAAATT